MQIRHETRNVIWKVAKGDIEMPIIGRRVLESLGCDNREMLLAARDRFGDEIDVTKRFEEDGNEEEHDSTTAALNGESVFHCGGQFDDDGLNEDDVYVDLGDDSARGVEKELEMKIEEAKSNGLFDGR